MLILFDIFIILLFILIGGLFTGIEMAFITLRDSQIDEMEKSEDKLLRKIAELAKNPNRFLSAGQIGVTFAGFLSASFSAATLMPYLEPLLEFLPISSSARTAILLVALTLFTSYLSLIFGELVPKRLALANPAKMARFTVRFIDSFASLMKPFVASLSFLTNLVVKILGGDPNITKEEITAEEIKSMLLGNAELAEDQKEILEDIFEARERSIAQIMTARTNVIFFEADDKIVDIVKTLASAEYTRYPVYDDDFDDVKGFVHIRDLLLEFSRNPKTVKKVLSFVRPLIRVPSTAMIIPALASIKASSGQMALVIDEYGGTDGIVTIEDILEEFVGEIYDEYDQGKSESLYRKTDGTIFLDGTTSIEDFFDETGIHLEDGPYETLAGYLLHRLGRLAKAGDEVILDGRKLVVSKVEHRAIARVKILGL